MVTIFVIAICLVIGGAILWKKFGNGVTRFTNEEKRAIEARIEAIKAKDTAAYIALTSEWNGLENTGIKKGQAISNELQGLISQVKKV